MKNLLQTGLLLMLAIYLPAKVHSQASGTDAGVSAIVSPSSNICEGMNDVIVTLRNYGNQALTSAQINWSLNNDVQAPVMFYGQLKKSESANVFLGKKSFLTGIYKIKAWTSAPNGTKDSKASNDTSVIVITVSPSLKPLIWASADTICAGDVLQLKCLNDATCSLEWILPDGTSSFARSISDKPKTADCQPDTIYYKLRVWKNKGCSVAEDSVRVIVIGRPLAKATADNAEICQWQRVSLSPGGICTNLQYYNIEWTGTNGFYSNEINAIDSPSCTTTYTLRITDRMGACKKSTISVSEVTVQVDSLPLADIIYYPWPSYASCDIEALAIPFFGTPPYKILWSTGDTTDLIDSLCYEEVFDLYLTVTDAKGCSSVNHPIFPLGVTSGSGKGGFKNGGLQLSPDMKDMNTVYHNLETTFHFSVTSENERSATVMLFDISGKMLQRETQPLHEGMNELKVSTANLSPGVYICKILYGGNQKTVRLLR